MDDTRKVFSTEIIRSKNRHKNNLYELINITPATPLPLRNKKLYTCNYTPRSDKFYIPKRRPGAKVKTVRDIRAMFEKDTLAYLTNDLETQQNYLLKKIRGGSSRNEATLKIAQKLLKSSNPLSRATWQMLMNINPERHLHPRQYALWNSKHIQVNGSTGGKNKLISSYDLYKKKLPCKRKTQVAKTETCNKKKGLLLHSLAIKFKPGPLAKKKFLGDSFQKDSSDIELIDLPKVGLSFQPAYGTALDSSITSFLGNLHKEDGTISAKWAEFATSMIGKVENSCANLLNSKTEVLFDLKYKCDQHRLLMRKDSEYSFHKTRQINTSPISVNIRKDDVTVNPEIKYMMTKILDAVEISVTQDSMFNVDEDVEEVKNEDSNVTTLSKDKIKKKFCELDRLDVTVIQLPGTTARKSDQNCKNAFCTLGCICDSLESTFNFKQHCGRVECIFDCKCVFSKYTNIKSLEVENSMIPGLINIEDKINLRLAKEEQKFHQTVIVTGENNILFKSQKRNWKSSKKYESFYKNMPLKNDNQTNKRELSVSVTKLNLKNVEPWCMVHSLYKCFCRGIFSDNTASSVRQSLGKDFNNLSKDITNDLQPMDLVSENSFSLKSHKEISVSSVAKPTLRPRFSKELKSLDNSTSERTWSKTVTVSDVKCNDYKRYSSVSENSDSCGDKYMQSDSESNISNEFYNAYNGSCSRVMGYNGRKYNDEHYKNTNSKIQDMENNDKKIQSRIRNIINLDTENETFVIQETNDQAANCENIQSIVPNVKLSNNLNLLNFMCGDTFSNENIESNSSHKPENINTDNKLVDWLESNYKMYKKRIDQGIYKASLEPPRSGKMALHSWEFILSRYKERKNFFFISKGTPYRIFMGVHAKSMFFKTCINIDEIRFADLHKYPQTVKNLLTYATNLKDNFCILRGLEHCWELVGSVAKVNRNDENIGDNSISNIDGSFQPSNCDIIDKQTTLSYEDSVDSQTTCLIENKNSLACKEQLESSKWFVMIVEKDFIEIRFYKKGFFVRYDSIIKAIKVAGVSTKTVRLSSHKCAENNSGPQFGVYAIPNANQDCVFIGPYELHDTLGIETIKKFTNTRKTNKTRGYWITTNKVDNLEIINNPLSFITPLAKSEIADAMPLETHFNEEERDKSKIIQETSLLQESPTKTVMNKKVVKPITIRKTNGFYHLATHGVLKKITLPSPPKISIGFPRPKTDVKIIPMNSLLENSDDAVSSHEDNTPAVTHEIQDEETPQIKISSVFSQREDIQASAKKSEGGMFILKPEEINRKAIGSQQTTETLSTSVTSDFEMFSETMPYSIFDDNNSAILTPCTVNTDVCVISDDDDDDEDDDNECAGRLYRNVMIQCGNFNNVGGLWARQRMDSKAISFKIPGDKYTIFYPIQYAFKKLNDILTVKLGITKRLIDWNWKLIESVDDDIDTSVDQLDLGRLYNLLENQENQSTSTNDNTSLVTKTVKTYSKKNSSSLSPTIEKDDETNDKLLKEEHNKTTSNKDNTSVLYKSVRTYSNKNKSAILPSIKQDIETNKTETAMDETQEVIMIEIEE